jgi:hypothetical protein
LNSQELEPEPELGVFRARAELSIHIEPARLELLEHAPPSQCMD